MSASLSVSGLRLGYRGQEPVLAVDALELAGRELLCMVGPNGGGKTTLLRCLAGLMPPRAGSVLLDGAPLYGRGALPRRARARQIAVVLTDAVVPAYLRVAELVALGRLPYAGTSRTTADDRRAVARALAQTGAEALADRPVGQLSDGERQRVLVARALAQQPRMLLLDEPAAHLDPPHQTALFVLLRDLIAQEIVDQVLVATHHLHLALHISDRLLLVADGAVCPGSAAELTADGALEHAFLDSGPATGSGHPRLWLDARRGWFVPGSG